MHLFKVFFFLFSIAFLAAPQARSITFDCKMDCEKTYKPNIQNVGVGETDLNKPNRDACLDYQADNCKKDNSSNSNNSNYSYRPPEYLDEQEEECATSTNLGHGGCSFTNTVRDVGKGTVAVSDVVGAASVGLKGSKEVQNLTSQQQDGSSVLRQSYISTAETYDEAASKERRGAWANFIGAGAMFWRSWVHNEDNKNALRKGKDSVGLNTSTGHAEGIGDVGGKVVSNYRDQIEKSSDYTKEGNYIVQRAMNEQGDAAGKALTEAIGFVSNGMTKWNAANNYNEAAKMSRFNAGLIQDPEDPLIDTTPTQTPTDPTTPFVEAQSTPVTKDETLAAKDPAPQEMPDLGAPFNTDPDPGVIIAPTPGAFTQSGPPAGGSAGGGTVGGLGGGANAAGAKHEEEAGARLADSGKNVNYGQAAAGYLPTNRGPAGGNAAPDLSGMLAQFLPKEEDKKNANGILDYKMGGRAPSQSGDESLLGQNENLFLRISEQYARQAKQKRIGI